MKIISSTLKYFYIKTSYHKFGAVLVYDDMRPFFISTLSQGVRVAKCRIFFTNP